MKKNLLAVLTVSLFVLVVSSKAEAMLVNGNFDDLSTSPVGKIKGHKQSDMTNGQWDVYDSINGWTAGRGSGIEVQYNSVVTASSGNYYVELDSHRGNNTNSSMHQSVSLETGDYNLGWMYHARTNTFDDNGIKAYLTDSSGNTIDIGSVSKTKNQQSSVWENIDWTFSIAEGSYELWFEAFGEENTYGGFIDSVELALFSSGGPGNVGPAPVPEPATMLLFGTGLACLAGIARRKKKYNS